MNGQKLLALTGGLGLLQIVPIFVSASENKNPNVIVILVDDVGYGDYGCYGNKVNQTPNIDFLAKKGAKFTDFHTNGVVSSPTRAALLTGRYQQYSGIEGVITAARHRDYGLSTDANTIAKLLKTNNYQTAIYGKWHLGYKPSSNPIHFGFDEFVGYISGNIDYFSHIDQEGYEDWWHNDKLVKDKGYTSYLITDYAESYIKENKNKSFFLYLPFETCHYPWQGPNDKPIRALENGEFKRRKGRTDFDNVYKEMMETLDVCVGRVVQAVEKAGIAENTLILFLSDNGGSNISCNEPYSGGKGSLLEGGHRVSSIAYLPSKIKGGTIISETLMTFDLLPTICELTNTSLDHVLYDGKSFWNTITLGKEMPERTLFWRTGGQVCARREDWKLTINRKTRKGTLVNLSTDIKEKMNLWDKYPDIVSRLLKEICEWESNFSTIKQFS